ncbi:MAG: hypothetical protein Q9220_004980 [cf. Caloplaca sp. 1 TL-2023]
MPAEETNLNPQLLSSHPSSPAADKESSHEHHHESDQDQGSEYSPFVPVIAQASHLSQNPSTISIASIAESDSRVIVNPPDLDRPTTPTQQQLSQGNHFSSPSSSPSSSSSDASSEEMPPTANPDWVLDRLEWHNMYQDNGSELARFPKLRDEAVKILSRKRESSATREDFQQFMTEFQFYENQNEDTLLEMLVPYVIRQDRKILVPKHGSEEAAFESVKFFNSGIATIVNREFTRGWVPFRQGRDQVDKELVAQMKKLGDKGMSNPKPDRAYGMRRNLYDFPSDFQMPAEILDFLEVLPKVNFIFLILEGKSESGSAAEARNQACRGGAALIHAHRLLLDFLGEKDTVGADHRTFVFSTTVVESTVKIWLHWAEVREHALPIYHMSQVVSRVVDDEQLFRQTRIFLHNILDWGAIDRFDELRSVYDLIVYYATGQPVASPAHKKQKTNHT